MTITALMPRPNVAFIPAAPYARGLDFVEKKYHLDRRRLLKGTGVEEDDLRDDHALLSLDQVEGMVKRIVELVGVRGGGLEFGSGLNYASHGPPGFAGLTAPNLAAATDIASRFMELVTPIFVLERTEFEDYHEIRLAPRYRMDPDVLRVHIHSALSSMFVLVGHGTKVLPEGTEVLLPTADPHVEQWLESQGIKPRVGSDVIMTRVPPKFMLTPFPLADAKVHAMAVAQCEELLAERRTQDRTIRDVRRLLRRTGPPFLDLGELGEMLGASPRTIRRRLEKEGASFRELLDEARFTWAAQALTDSDRSVTEIAFDLGYSAPANFTRAFGRAVGMSPRAYRNANHRGIKA